MLDEAGVKRRSVPIQGRTRVSLNVQDLGSGLEYRFVPEGPTLAEAEWRSVLAVLEEVEGDWLIASGSLPNGVPDDAYAQVARIAARRGQRFVLDTSGSALRAALDQGGLELVKPSLSELEHLLDRDLTDPAEQDAHAMDLVWHGLRQAGGGHAGPRRSAAGHAGWRGADAGNGRPGAQHGRRGGCLPGRDDAGTGTWSHADRMHWPGVPRRAPLPSRAPAPPGFDAPTWRARHRQLTGRSG